MAIAIVLVSTASCSRKQPAPPAPPEPAPAPANESAPQTFKGAVDFHGVHFTNDESVFSDVAAEIVPATPLEDPEDKPDDNWPEHVRFSLSPAREPKHETFFEPEIRVVSISDYKEAFQVEPRYVETMETDIDRLKKLITNPSSYIPAKLHWFEDSTSGGDTGGIPFLPFVDASQVFAVHVTRVDFNGGSGLAFVTQYDIEPSLVNNAALTWIFQGFTSDGEKYIVATFPIRSSILAETGSQEEGHRGYKPGDFSRVAAQKALYAYVESVRSDLERLPANQFEPDLASLEKLIRGIRIDR